MPRKHPLVPVLACLLAGLLAWGCAAARTGAATAEDSGRNLAAARQSHAAAIVSESARALRELRKETHDRILDHALTEARAVIVLPGVYRAGFIYSLHGGDGVLVARRADGGWSAPVFLSLFGAGYGWQAGAEKSRVALVIDEDATLARILDTGLSFDAAAGFDILNVRQTTGPSTLTEKRPVLAFSDGAGMMAGIAFNGGSLRVNQGLTASYHGAAAGDAAAILKGANAPGIETFELWSALLADLPDEGAPPVLRTER